MSKLFSWMKKSPRKTEEGTVSPGKFGGLFTRSSRFNRQTFKDCLYQASADLMALRPKIDADMLQLEIQTACYLSDHKEDLLIDHMELDNRKTAIVYLSQYCEKIADRITSATEADMDIPETLKEKVADLCFVADRTHKLPLEPVKVQLSLLFGKARIVSVLSSHTSETMKGLFAIPNPSAESCHTYFSRFAKKHDKYWFPASLQGEELEQHLRAMAEQIALARPVQPPNPAAPLVELLQLGLVITVRQNTNDGIYTYYVEVIFL